MKPPSETVVSPEGHSGSEERTAFLPLAEEQATLSKREIEGDHVTVTTRTELVEEVVRETLRTEGVTVRRIPVNRTLSDGEVVPVLRREGLTTIIPVLEEIVVIEKRLVLKEELHVTRTASTEDIEVPVTLRRQSAVIERTGPDGRIIRNQEEETRS